MIEQLDLFHKVIRASDMGHEVRARVGSDPRQLTLTHGAGPVPERDVITAQAMAHYQSGGFTPATMEALLGAQETQGRL